MTDNAPASAPSSAPTSLPALVEGSVAPWLSVTDGPGAVQYYRAAFGAVERYRLEDRTGRVVVARLTVGQEEFWLQENRDAGPDPCEGRVRMALTVDDPEEVFRRAIAAGATEIAPIRDGPGWRRGRLADPFGHHWSVGASTARPSGGKPHG